MNGDSQQRLAARRVSHPPCMRTANIEAFSSFSEKLRVTINRVYNRRRSYGFPRRTEERTAVQSRLPQQA